MVNRYEDKICLVTASTAGIGLAIATRFAQEGGKVFISSRKQANVDKAIEEVARASPGGAQNVAGIPCNASKDEDRVKLVDAVVKKWGRIDVFVSNNATSLHMGDTLGTSEKAWDTMFKHNVKAAFMLAKLCEPHFPKSGGSILFMSSYYGYTPIAPIGVYGVTKTALFGLTKSLADELGPRNIRVNCVAPGIIKTNFSSSLWQDGDGKEVSADEHPLVARTILRRFGEPKDIAGPVSFLCSDDAAYVTGEVVLATGGLDSRL